MLKHALAIMAAAAGLSAATARADDLRWQGTFFITEVSPTCVAAGHSTSFVGDQWTFVFRDDADHGQAFSIIGQRRAMAFVPDGGKFKKSGKHQGTYIGGNVVPRQGPGKYSAFKFTPAKLDGGDRTIAFSGKITDFAGDDGCDVSFEAAGVRRPGY